MKCLYALSAAFLISVFFLTQTAHAAPLIELGSPNTKGSYTIEVNGKSVELVPALVVSDSEGVHATPLSEIENNSSDESFSFTDIHLTTLGAQWSNVQGPGVNIGIGWIVHGYGYEAESAFIEIQPGLAGQMLSVGYQKLTEFGIYGGAITGRASYYFTTGNYYGIDKGQQYAGASLSATFEVVRLTGGVLFKTVGEQGSPTLLYLAAGVGF